MPDSNETPDQRAERLQSEKSQALKWLETKWPNRICPICGTSGWTIDNILEMRQFEGGNLVIGGSSMVTPLFPVTCNTCGYTFFINAIRAGAIDPKAYGDKK